MIIYSDTTVFNVNAQTIVNTVNCIGVMGGGLALEFKLRFPEMYEDYVERCKRKEVKIGRPYLYRGYETPWIMNFPTKEHWKYPSKLQWVRQGLEYFVVNYERYGITSIAFPPLGCSKGKLDWRGVKSVMEEYLQDVSIDVYICLDRERKASGIEELMVNMINNTQNQFWISELEIRRDIVAKIVTSLPINRFRELKQIRGVGTQTYNNLFKVLYSKALTTQQIPDVVKSVQLTEARQLRLFD
ncbi:MAG: macro domain-containing protein [Candidatus Poribacteria bacterium]